MVEETTAAKGATRYRLFAPDPRPDKPPIVLGTATTARGVDALIRASRCDDEFRQPTSGPGVGIPDYGGADDMPGQGMLF